MVPRVPWSCTAADVAADPDAICQCRDEALLLLSAVLFVQMAGKEVV